LYWCLSKPLGGNHCINYVLNVDSGCPKDPKVTLNKCRFGKIFLLSDEQIRHIFDSCRNLGICGAVFVAADWELSQIKSMASMASMVDVFNGLVFVILIIVGVWLFSINQIQAFRKLKESGILGVKLTIAWYTYSLVALILIASVFLH